MMNLRDDTFAADDMLTASDLARICQVDLKTIHNWTDKGEIHHHRTPGRHLRFRAEDVAAFLKRYGYPIPPALASLGGTGFRGMCTSVEVLDGRLFLSVVLDEGADIEAVRAALSSKRISIMAAPRREAEKTTTGAATSVHGGA